MLVSRSLNKAIPVVEGVIFTATGVTTLGFSLFLQNQHSLNTLVYYFEESVDGTTWTRLEFANGGDSNEFALIAATLSFPLQGTVQVKVVPSGSNTRVRMKAYGDVPASFGISSWVPSATDTTAISITL